MMSGFGGSMGFGMGFGWIFFLIIIGVVIWAVVRLTNSTTHGNTQIGTTSQRETALGILQKRYAQGEITESEYKQMRGNL